MGGGHEVKAPEPHPICPTGLGRQEASRDSKEDPFRRLESGERHVERGLIERRKTSLAWQVDRNQNQKRYVLGPITLKRLKMVLKLSKEHFHVLSQRQDVREVLKCYSKANSC